MERPAIAARGLRKSFGAVEALVGIDVSVPAGTILGLLGPNGAGKTTAVRIFTTLIPPDDGVAEVAGFDVVRDAKRLRSSIGLAGQFAAVDESLTGRENVELVGHLYHLSRKETKARAEQILETFDLTDAADRPVKTYSGGMRRRLDLGASLVGRPQVLFLDEPTTGLDPRSRLDLWAVIEELVADGTTVLLTTQYLEEADRLADSIAVIDHGGIIAEGTAEDLKTRVGGDLIDVRIADRGRVKDAAKVLEPLAHGETQVDQDVGRIVFPLSDGAARIAEVVRCLDAEDLAIVDLALRRPTLDDVFLKLTGRPVEHDEPATSVPEIAAERSAV